MTIPSEGGILGIAANKEKYLKELYNFSNSATNAVDAFGELTKDEKAVKIPTDSSKNKQLGGPWYDVRDQYGQWMQTKKDENYLKGE